VRLDHLLSKEHIPRASGVSSGLPVVMFRRYWWCSLVESSMMLCLACCRHREYYWLLPFGVVVGVEIRWWWELGGVDTLLSFETSGPGVIRVVVS
jgi:hypothetical protein